MESLLIPGKYWVFIMKDNIVSENDQNMSVGYNELL